MKKFTAIISLITALAICIGTSGCGKKHSDGETPDSYETTVESSECVSASETENTTAARSNISAEFSVVNSWSDGSGIKCTQFKITVTNNEQFDLSSWTITADIPDGCKIQNQWGCACEINGTNMTVKPVDYTKNIASGAKNDNMGFIIESREEISKICGICSTDDKPAAENTAAKTTAKPQIGENSKDNQNGNNSSKNNGDNSKTEKAKENQKPKTAEKGTPLANHGRLSVKGTNIVDKNGSKYQLKGVSTHGLAWFPQYVSESSFKTLRDDWGANTVRLAMYTAEYGGYCSGGSKSELESLVSRGVDACSSLGMYAVIDWHILSDGNPMTNKSSAKSFFAKMSEKYKNNENVIYEICNEPNGGTSWSEIKKYADEIISEIRSHDSDAIIIVGTPTWSQDVDQVSKNPVKNGKNVMYALHFYAATHKDSLRSKLKNAISAGTPVFISEFSICDASGAGGIDYDEAKKWQSLINDYNLSYMGWSLSNKSETSALIKSGCSKTSGWSESDLSDTGKWLRKMIKGS